MIGARKSAFHIILVVASTQAGQLNESRATQLDSSIIDDGNVNNVGAGHSLGMSIRRRRRAEMTQIGGRLRPVPQKCSAAQKKALSQCGKAAGSDVAARCKCCSQWHLD